MYAEHTSEHSYYRKVLCSFVPWNAEMVIQVQYSYDKEGV